MTGLFGGFLLIVTGYTRRMEGEVQQRTAELADANQQLQVQLDATRKAEANVSYLALHDSLTGLPNRPCWLNMARRALEAAGSKASWRCCFWTWTNSRPSTTAWAIRWVTSCWSALRAVCNNRCRQKPCWPVWAVTNSSS
jgi:hypothetical protein